MAAAETAAPKKKGKGRAKFLILGIVALLLLAGGGAGFAAFKGMGPFARKKAPTAPEKPKVVAKKPVPPPPAPAPTSVVRTLPPTTAFDPEEGAIKLAKLWNQLDPPKLLAISKDWKDPEFARVAIKMDAGQVAELLAAMPPKRASSLSREMQKIASIVPAP